MAPQRNEVVLGVVNLVAFLDFVAINAYCLGHGYYGHGKPTQFGPSSKTFGIWTVIQVLLLGTQLHQVSDAGKLVLVDSLGWAFPLLIVLNTAYLALWSIRHFVFAFIAAVHVSVLSTYIYFSVKEHAPKNLRDEVFVQIPISMLHAWSTFLLFEAGFEAFGIPQDMVPGAWTKFFILFSVICLEATSAAYAFSAPEGDLAGSLVITWAFYGLVERQGNSLLGLAALIISLFWVAKAMFGLSRRKPYYAGDEPAESERASLIESA